ncbi:MAG TPA: ABC transporter permease [Candidatus Nanoarchaeia archaeon]|nr:ABC transporter permease [Candidatus Nanoarchaeia archaeon]
MIKDYFFLALGNLKHRGLRSWLTMLGIFIGIAAVVSLISLGSGLQEAVTSQFGTLSLDILTVQNAQTGFGPPGSTVIKKLNEHDVEVLEEVNGVRVVVPRLIRVASVEFNKARRFEFMASIPENTNQKDLVYSELKVSTEFGRLLESGDKGKVVLGSGFSSERFGKELKVGSIIKINGENFEVIGILEPSGSFIINEAILMMEDDMEGLLNIDDEIDLIVIQVEDKNKIGDITEEVRRKIRDDRNLKEGEEDFTVQTPDQSLEGINTILSIINYIVIGIAALSLIVGGVGITNTMYTSVLERTKEIGVMKSIGAQNKDILMIFLIESGLLGLVGGIIGALIGLGLAFSVSSAAGQFLGGIDIKIVFSYPLLIGSVLFSFLVGILSGLLPAIQASKLKPVEALRR